MQEGIRSGKEASGIECEGEAEEGDEAMKGCGIEVKALNGR
jgi:hypothetical protein